MITHPLTRTAAAAAALLLGAVPLLAQAQDKADPTKEFVQKVNNATGLEFWGYARSGFYVGHKDQGRLRGNYSLGGDLHKYRLGNEGDHYIEFGIGKRFDLGDGLKWGVFYMPKIYNGDTGTAQAYATMTGIFDNSATLWAGQRFHRIQDVHIVDNWVMEDGDNYGAGIDDIPMFGVGTLNVALHTSDSFDNKAGNVNDAKRVNLQWRKIPTNPGGSITLTAGLISGDFARGSDGGALGIVHNQKDFLVKGLNNSLMLQASTGHSDIRGKFSGLDVDGTSFGGAKQRRILDVVDFQLGKLGGQALIGYQTIDPDDGGDIKDFSLGGRVSYGIAKRTKLLAEIATTQRKVDGEANRRLNKGTVAVAFAPNTDFWTRPEFRIYYTHANWNNAARLAAANSYGFGGKRNNNTFGVQMEVWWE
ncbi:carbohydrate porin [Pseudorhodoferax sp. Leaf267]|uniref:carbohydrate porin n=1 Tax=Pseudorhodoferax sp. Leaf267 TaxID=1736316 RepID=UPI0006F57147|nr:carbohydrate porin [Pseudorhodoferax sp. Leaf267]KQP20587.1 porin [Pseudorhodoferax sp. Leaf267]